MRPASLIVNQCRKMGLRRCLLAWLGAVVFGAIAWVALVFAWALGQ